MLKWLVSSTSFYCEFLVLVASELLALVANELLALVASELF